MIRRTCFCAAYSVASGLAAVPGSASSPRGIGATWISTAADRETLITKFDAIAHAMERDFIQCFAWGDGMICDGFKGATTFLS